MRGGRPAESSRPWGRAQRMLGVRQWLADVGGPPSVYKLSVHLHQISDKINVVRGIYFILLWVFERLGRRILFTVIIFVR